MAMWMATWMAMRMARVGTIVDRRRGRRRLRASFEGLEADKWLAPRRLAE